MLKCKTIIIQAWLWQSGTTLAVLNTSRLDYNVRCPAALACTFLEQHFVEGIKIASWVSLICCFPVPDVPKLDSLRQFKEQELSWLSPTYLSTPYFRKSLSSSRPKERRTIGTIHRSSFVRDSRLINVFRRATTEFVRAGYEYYSCALFFMIPCSTHLDMIVEAAEWQTHTHTSRF